MWPLDRDAFINWIPVVSQSPHCDGGYIWLHRMAEQMDGIF